MRQRHLNWWVLLLVGCFLLANSAVAGAAEKVVLQLRWQHQFQFAGYYMAAELGYYRDAGLDVEIRPRGKGQGSPVEEVLAGRADIGISDTELLVQRSLGKPVVAIAAIFQQSSSVFITLAHSGVTCAADLAGKKVPLGVGDYRSIVLRALLAQEDLLDRIQLVDQPYDLTKLINGDVDTLGGGLTDQPYQLKRQGYAVNIINPLDYGIDFYGDTLFTTEGFIKKSPLTVEKFRQASLRGWQYAIDHPAAAIHVIQQTYQSSLPLDVLQYEAAETIKLVRPRDGADIGSMNLLKWGKSIHHLMALGIVSPEFYLEPSFLYTPPPGVPWQQLQDWILGIVLSFALLAGIMVILSKKNIELHTIKKELEKEIEERKNLTQSLSEQKAFSTSLIDTAQMIILVLDLEGNILSFNPYLEKLGGYKLSEVVGKNWFSTFLPEEIVPEILEIFEQLLSERQSCDHVNKIVTKTGEKLDIEWKSEALCNSDGVQIGVLAIGRNITAELQSEQQLHRYREIVSATGDPMSFVDNDYIYQAVNPAYLAVHNKTADEVINHSVAEVVGKEVFDSVIKERLDRCLTGKNIHYQTWVTTAGWGKKFFDVAYHPYRRDGEKITGVVASLRDMTELKQLQDEQVQLLQAVSQLNESIIVTNLDTEIVYVNPAFEQITGYLATEVLGKNPRLLQSGQTEAAVYTDLWSTLTAGHVWRGEFYNNKKDGSLFVEKAVVSPVVDSSGVVVNYIAVKRDITHERQMETQLRQKFKLETIGTMAGGMAHNFNNNLAIILGNIDLAKTMSAEQKDIDRYLDNARIAVLRARDLIANILSYSRQGTHQKAVVCVAEVIEETYALIQPTLPATVTFQCLIESKNRNLTIHADSSQLQEILLNLCSNAIYAMDEEGDLTISLEGVECLEKDAPEDEDIAGGFFAKISVCDSGHGISPEILNKIFDPFFTTKAEGSGTGMGLATVQGIVSQHGGMIKVKSEPGVGSCFDLYFPIIERRQQPRQVTLPSSSTISGGSEKILFIDDEELLAEAWSEILSSSGYRVTMMTSSTEALKLFTANADFFDLVITDQTMPEMSGDKLIREIHAIRADIPVILCSGYSTKVSAQQSDEIGAAGFCMKPLAREVLLPLIRTALDKP